MPLSKEELQKGETSRKRKRESTPSGNPVKSPAAKRKKEIHDRPAFTVLKIQEDLTVQNLVCIHNGEFT